MAALKQFLIIVDDCDYILGFKGLNEHKEDSFDDYKLYFLLIY